MYQNGIMKVRIESSETTFWQYLHIFGTLFFDFPLFSRNFGSLCLADEKTGSVHVRDTDILSVDRKFK